MEESGDIISHFGLFGDSITEFEENIIFQLSFDQLILLII